MIHNDIMSRAFYLDNENSYTWKDVYIMRLGPAVGSYEKVAKAARKDVSIDLLLMGTFPLI